jgi:D-alanine-D-alanine ligase
MAGLKVAVLTGGRSSEREASLASLPSLTASLAEAGHTAILVDVDPTGVWRRDGRVVALEPGRGIPGVDVAFPVLIGAFGEDGTVQGLLECLGIPYVGAGVLASAVGMDKGMFKRLIAQSGLPQADYRHVRADAFEANRETELKALAELGLPVFVKPSSSGSSLGVARVSRPEDLGSALAQAFAFGPSAIVEAAAPGSEIECSVLGNDVLVTSLPGEVVGASRSGWRDHEFKTSDGGVDLFVPARVPDNVLGRIRERAEQVYRLIGCCGFARVDFFVDRERILINEINTMPSIQATSVFSLMFEWSGVPYRDLLDRLLALAMERHRSRSHDRI